MRVSSGANRAVSSAPATQPAKGSSPSSSISGLAKAGVVPALVSLVPKEVRQNALQSFVRGLANAVRGVIRNILEGLKDMLQGLGKLLTGNWKQGLRSFGVGLLKTVVQTPVDFALLVGGRAISSVQTLLGIEAPGRGLSEKETAQLRKVFGDSIDYSKIVIKEGNAGVGQLSGNRAFVHGNTIYMKKTPDSQWDSTLTHEVTHVWQFQNGGTDYMSEALWQQIREGSEAYNWRAAVDAGKPWHELKPEQQAELVGDIFRRGAAVTGRLVVGGHDYSEYAAIALKELRAGRGAT